MKSKTTNLQRDKIKEKTKWNKKIIPIILSGFRYGEEGFDEHFVADEIEKLISQAQEEARRDYKENVVKYALDTLEADMLSGGLSERDGKILERLRYWMIEREVRFGERGELDNQLPQKEK